MARDKQSKAAGLKDLHGFRSLFLCAVLMFTSAIDRNVSPLIPAVRGKSIVIDCGVFVLPAIAGIGKTPGDELYRDSVFLNGRGVRYYKPYAVGLHV